MNIKEDEGKYEILVMGLNTEEDGWFDCDKSVIERLSNNWPGKIIFYDVTKEPSQKHPEWPKRTLLLIKSEEAIS